MTLLGVLLADFSYGQERRRREFNVEEWLQQRDRNNNGVLEPNEINERDGRFLERMEIDVTRPVVIAQVVAKVNQERLEQQKQREDEEFAKLPRRVPGFGESITRTDLPGFGVEVSSDKTNRIPGFGLTDDQVLESMISIREQFGRDIDQQVERTFEQYDKNKDGLLDASEIAEIPWGNPSWEEFDQNNDGQISMIELAKRYQARSGDRSRRGGDNNDNDNNRRGAQSNNERGTNQQNEGRRFAGRNQQPAQADERSTPDAQGRGRTESTPRTNRSGGSMDQFVRYVKSTLEQHDTNKNGVIDGDELDKIGIMKKADTDKDGKVTYDELLAYVSGNRGESGESSGSSTDTSNSAANSTGRDGSTRNRGGASRGSTRNRTVEDEPENRIIRDLRSIENIVIGSEEQRVPLTDDAVNLRRERLTREFTQMDKNGDGQIQLIEFASKLTVDEIAEFNRIDRNGDGVITINEWNDRK